MPRRGLVDEWRGVTKIPRVLHQTVPIGRFNLKRNVLALELSIAVAGSGGVEIEHPFGRRDDRTVCVESVRPPVWNGAFREGGGGGDEFTADVAVKDTNLNDRERIRNVHDHRSCETLLPVFVGHHQRNGVHAWRGEGVRDLRSVAKRTVREGPIPDLNVSGVAHRAVRVHAVKTVKHIRSVNLPVFLTEVDLSRPRGRQRTHIKGGHRHLVQDNDVQHGGGLAPIVVRHGQRNGFVAGYIPGNDRVDGAAAHGGEIVVPSRRTGTDTDAVGEGPVVGQDLTVVVDEHIGKDQAGVRHRGHGFCVNLHRDSVVDLDEQGFRSNVNAVGHREGEVERLAHAVDVVPLVLLCVNTNPTALGSIAPVPLEIKVFDGHVVHGATCREQDALTGEQGDVVFNDHVVDRDHGHRLRDVADVDGVNLGFGPRATPVHDAEGGVVASHLGVGAER